MKQAKTVLLVADFEPQTKRILDLVFDSRDYKIIECRSGREAIHLCLTLNPDLLLLETELPDLGGHEVIAAIRSKSQLPIIIISAQETDQHVIDALNVGADDYVIKPFNADVLYARVNAALRKSMGQDLSKPTLSNGPLMIDLVRHEVYIRDKPVAFTPKEYQLLHYFLTHQGKMLGHKTLLHEIWGAGHTEDTQYLRVFIGQIREKIESEATLSHVIKTELGVGYRMEIVPEAPPINTQSELGV